MTKPSITFLSGREVSYTRNRVILQALKSKFNLKVAPTHSRSILVNTALSTLHILTKQETDLYFSGFLGQPISILLHKLKKPYILDFLVSVYETLCEDRNVFRKNSVYAKLSFWLDFFALSKAKLVITDTWSNALFFSQRFGVGITKFAVAYVGCDEETFNPKVMPQEQSGKSRKEVIVFTYNSFLPLHGNEVIVEAARMLEDDPRVKLVIGGYGPLFRSIREQVLIKGIKNIEFVGWIPYERLPNLIENSDICLGGHFSTTPKAGRSLSTKTFQFMAMRKPIIVGEGEAASELLKHGVNAYIVPRGDPGALAIAIRELADDLWLRQRLGAEAYDLFQKKFSTSRISEMLERAILRACESV